ncbi:hypothetical protein CDAR_111721 [Caerostris darwini]|uniref:DNA-directed DNA polymerase n=1 Tax=Caerostris darwini TaxID=1538125 RepID=A0AAV4QYK0_9ARAC|nr:hypothetical protein CDAR_111721 [Caerostris darwini]
MKPQKISMPKNTTLKFTNLAKMLYHPFCVFADFANRLTTVSYELQFDNRKARSTYVEDYNKNKPHNYIVALDANNLYGYVMSQPVPVGNFSWLRPKKCLILMSLTMVKIQSPPAKEILSPDSPPLHEQSVIPEVASDIEMDTSQIVTREDFANTDFPMSHPATRRLSDPTPEHLLFFEDLLKEAATLMAEVQKYPSAAHNIRSPTWEKASLTIEECNKRIKAICTYIGVPAYQLPTKMELNELRQMKELQELAKNYKAPA